MPHNVLYTGMESGRELQAAGVPSHILSRGCLPSLSLLVGSTGGLCLEQRPLCRWTFSLFAA